MLPDQPLFLEGLAGLFLFLFDDFAKRLPVPIVGEQTGSAYARLIFRIGAYFGERGFKIRLRFRREVRRRGESAILGGFELIAKLVHGRDVRAELIAILGCNGEAARALLALAAFPPFALFISEFLTFVAGVQSGPIWVVVLVAIGLTGVYFALTGIALKSIFGKAPEGMKRHEVPALMIIPEIALAIVVMWFGIATPVAITSGVEDATSVVLNQSVEELHEAPLYRMVFSSQTKTSEVN